MKLFNINSINLPKVPQVSEIILYNQNGKKSSFRKKFFVFSALNNEEGCINHLLDVSPVNRSRGR